MLEHGHIIYTDTCSCAVLYISLGEYINKWIFLLSHTFLGEDVSNWIVMLCHTALYVNMQATGWLCCAIHHCR